MGTYDCAEVCELVGVFILSQLSRKYNKNNIGLYRDDGLTVFRNIIGQQEEKIKKRFQNILRKNNLSIIVNINKQRDQLHPWGIKSFSKYYKTITVICSITFIQIII